MNKIRKGDTVIINTGKDKGKQGVVLKLDGGKALVEGLNMVKKHTKPNPSKNDQGGLINKEMPIQLSNIAIYNNALKKADKVTFKELKDGKKIRIFKSNQEAIDV
ncbi:50S ribosomal protein L24 [Methylophilaceae bacterium]|nr:50S ribosomal protein L24 [Methylophilaceae bacterium]MDC1011304.1 50S ribosomal protein L24 [Methylophilaceae bacterium]